ncbi:MAG: hypothetical protein GEV28_40375 [Actinophytocola sp.]|uniref:WXG100 family type VII secretion target n=1 Tax=Actinophytocola sp. TaxID=1872138 RepID=UPI001320DC47|nr:hypothetical protein [Actinophytocola sp.]MPZ86297.1 hypothetical protein [Actinophytocola sp.]
MGGEFRVSPGALQAKAGYDQDRAGVIDGLKTQIQQARTTEDCFGLIGMNAGFATGYDDMVDNVEENVGKAAEYLRSSADRLNASAEQYSAIDDGWAGHFQGVTDQLSDTNFSQVGGFQAATPEVDAAADAGGLVDAVGDFRDASSLPAVFVAGVQVKRTADDLLSHPMQGFWDNGLGFLVEWCMFPFRPLFEQVTGDPDQMRATGEGWARMAGFVNQLADADASEQEGLRQYWEGEAADKQNTQKTEFQDGLRSLADCCLQLQEHLNQVADFFEGLWDILVDIVREFVEGLIITWLAALATSAISFGSSVAAAWATSAARVSVTLSRILMQISKALQWLVRALRALKEIQTAIKEIIKAQSLMVRLGLRAVGVNKALRFLDPMALLVKGATGLTGTKPGATALDSGTELATDTVLQEAGEEAAGENQRNDHNEDAMDRGFA